MELDQRVVVFAGILIVALGGFASYLTGRTRGGRVWALGWLFLCLSAALAEAATHSPAAGVLYPALGTSFAGCLYMGTRRFAGLGQPDWLVPVVVATAAVRMLLQPFVPTTWTEVTWAGCVTVAALASIRLLIPLAGARYRSPWERALVFAPFLIMAGSWLDAYAWIGGATAVESRLAWLPIGIVSVGLQLGAILGQLAREALQERAMLEALIQSVPMGLALTDAGQRVRMVNEPFARRFGTTPEMLLGLTTAEAAEHFLAELEPEDERAVRRDASRIFHPRRPDAGTEFRFRDGGISIGLTLPVRERGGARAGRLWLLRDVTEERRLEDQLRRARQLETLGRLAGGVAHDFNNKLTAILGSAALMRRSLEQADPRRHDLADLEEAALYCAAVTRDLLDFSQQTPRSPEALPIRRLLETLREQLSGELGAGVRLDLEVAPDAPAAVVADRHQIERVVTNLVLNARDAVEADGCITIEAGAAGSARVEIAVRDDGPGIDKETRDRIFDPFFSTKGEGRGSGLGLAIVYGIVTSHGGEVGVESTPGRGARFSTTWPCDATAAAELHPPAAAPEPGPGRGECVLVVDDEASVRRVLRTSLEQAGYAVAEACDAQHALERFGGDGAGIDLALLDVSMPGMGGRELLARLRQRRADLPAVLTSGNFGPEPVEPGVQRLQKPFRPAEVVELVSRSLADPEGTGPS